MDLTLAEWPMFLLWETSLVWPLMKNTYGVFNEACTLFEDTWDVTSTAHRYPLTLNTKILAKTPFFPSLDIFVKNISNSNS